MTDTRAYWLDTMEKIAFPVLSALAEDRLTEVMPVCQHAKVSDAATHTYLEAFGRIMTGIGPWLNTAAEDADEEKKRREWVTLVRRALRNATDPSKKDCMNFSKGGQPIVDAAFLAEGLLRCFEGVWLGLDEETKRFTIERMKETRTRKPYFCNWLLFSAMIESFLKKAGEPDWDRMRIDFALKQHEQWYRGDGVYSDGTHFHFDYYNSFVIQPMLLDILDAVGEEEPDWRSMREPVSRRAARGAAVLEELIAPDGSYPVIGRSTTYRFGSFQLLAQAALDDFLTIPPAQARCALTAVIERVMAYPTMFDKNGFLNIGVCGAQPRMGEPYISTGSLYLCCAVFLPLGLTESAPFWSDPDCPWTQKRIWAGEDTVCVHALD